MTAPANDQGQFPPPNELEAELDRLIAQQEELLQKVQRLRELAEGMRP